MDVQYFILKTFYVAVFNFLLFHKKKKNVRNIFTSMSFCALTKIFSLRYFLGEEFLGQRTLKHVIHPLSCEMFQRFSISLKIISTPQMPGIF